MPDKTCKFCKRQYKYIKFVSGRLFCSKECYKKYSHEKQAKYCVECNKKFYTRSEKKFCSNSCRINYLKNRKINYKCNFCKKEMLMTIREYISSKLHFCSNKCHGNYKAENNCEENNPNWRGGKIEKSCEFCGKEFKVKIVRKKYAKFCSQECFGKWRIRNNFNFNGHKVGKRKDLGNTFFRSRWEANFARYLNYLEIKWEYEPKTFFFNKEKTGTKHYTPDFYLVDLDLYVEVKGYLSPIGHSKLKKMEKYYPKIKIFLFVLRDYSYIEKNYGWKIKDWEWNNEEETENMLIYQTIIKKLPENFLKMKKALDKNRFLFKKVRSNKIPNYFLKTFKETIDQAKEENKIPLVVFVEKNSRTPILMCNFLDLNKILDLDKISEIKKND